MKILFNTPIKEAIILERLKHLKDGPYWIYLLKCKCTNLFKLSSRQIHRNKELSCPSCYKAKRKQLITDARKKKLEWVAPPYRTCRSCGETKDSNKFPPKRNTCKECFNIGRTAYYHNKISKQYLTSL
jgi:hypothetical protein